MKIITYLHKGKVKNVSVDDLKKLKVQLTEAWEGVCQKCGKCCFEKSLKNNVWMINYSKPCQFLKFVNNKAQCSVYHDRFSRAEKCNTIPEAIQKKYLPSSCPYTKQVAQYKSPLDDGMWYKRAKQKLSKEGGYFLAPGVQWTSTMPAKAPYKETGNLTREDLSKPKEVRARIQEMVRRNKEKKALIEGTVGTKDAKQTTEFNIKPSGHALGG